LRHRKRIPKKAAGLQFRPQPPRSKILEKNLSQKIGSHRLMYPHLRRN
jgi:hypothetical protein